MIANVLKQIIKKNPNTFCPNEKRSLNLLCVCIFLRVVSINANTHHNHGNRSACFRFVSNSRRISLHTLLVLAGTHGTAVMTNYLLIVIQLFSVCIKP